ncbi:putative manganese-dependent inorganic diphosphatase [Clostridium sp. SYSU_GA19001]|uniref:putative manganese-dependent inorganic diphosphatase n=1 Tax=Clostridium caldaquaticum TaxID=2940653 RepID=UPI0020770DC7|nr:putative manganese-dependent inorganic diphosphatase [Clostridium caldaquaticum]MCM8710994.1 putative manganese-dependent inorganic diphosphatase [Clostridium caldaquaticum]
MNEVLYITGHKNPDTDSICAAIAYAEFKNKTGTLKAIPVRLGDINRETRFILDYFNVETPKLIETVKVQVSDLNIDTVAPVAPDISLKMAWNIMKKNNTKTLPVVDENDFLVGVATITNLFSSFMDIWDNNILSKSHTKLENILDTLSAKYVYIHDENINLSGKIVTAAMQPDSTEAIVEKGDIVICGDREDTQDAVIRCGASLIIITGNHTASEDIIEKAKTASCSIISTPYDSFTASRLITQSIPISYVMNKDNIVSFRTEDFVDDIRDVMLETRYRSYPVIDKLNKVIGTISRYHLISQNRKKVILVDHNERTQSVHGLEDAEVLEIIDHHRIADIQTGNPIYFRNEPVGSTSTIIASIFFENGIRPSKKIAGLLCAAIISDTLLFKSPTSTNVDKLMLKRLAEIADLDVENFAREMFKAGTSLNGRTVDEIFHQDFKVFTLNNLKIGISQISTMDLEGFADMKNDMISLMEKKSVENSFNLLVFMLTDILKGGSELLVVGKDKELVARAFNVKLNGHSIYVPGVLSRKKQVIPPITSAITSLK